jgi:hypothetical protein
MRDAGYCDKQPSKAPPLEQINNYPGSSAPDAAKFGKGTSTREGAAEAANAVRNNQGDPARYGRKVWFDMRTNKNELRALDSLLRKWLAFIAKQLGKQNVQSTISLDQPSPRRGGLVHQRPRRAPRWCRTRQCLEARGWHNGTACAIFARPECNCEADIAERESSLYSRLNIWAAQHLTSNTTTPGIAGLLRNTWMSISIGNHMTAKELVSAVESLTAEQRVELLQKLQAAKIDDIKAAAEKRRLAKMHAAMSDERMQPTIKLVKGALHRIGINDFVQASDMAKLNKSMSDAGLDMAARIEIKRQLSLIGVVE